MKLIDHGVKRHSDRRAALLAGQQRVFAEHFTWGDAILQRVEFITVEPNIQYPFGVDVKTLAYVTLPHNRLTRDPVAESHLGREFSALHRVEIAAKIE